MKIIQITDPHIGGPDQETHGVDTKANLIKTLQRVKNESPDAIILSGDLCFREPRRDVYEWIRDRLREYNLKPILLSGNHDDTQVMCDVFGLEDKDGELYFELEWLNTQVLFLDTSKAVMSETQWKWFESTLDRNGRVIIFTHYPPIEAFVPYMDSKHGFQQSERFMNVVGTSERDVHLFCGHYHVDKSICRGNLHVHITPSGFFQIRDDIEDFGVDHYSVGYQVIRLDGESMAYEVRYLDAGRRSAPPQSSL